MSALPCAALESEHNSQDLGALPQIAATVEWVREDGQFTIALPLVITGQWVMSHHDAATKLIALRSQAGLNTLVVPKYRPGDWTRILNAPTKVEATQGEFRSFEWGPLHFPIPGFVVFRTSLHAAKWGEAPGVGPVLLGYRPRTTAGAVVLCAAVLTAKLAGLHVAAQQSLYDQILEASAQSVRNSDDSIQAEPETLPTTLDEFLEQERELGAAFLIATLVSSEQSADALALTAHDLMGIVLGSSTIVHLAARVPNGTQLADIYGVLERRGWGAHLRRLASAVSRNLAPPRRE